MAWILTLETASTNCSVGLFENTELRALREDPSPPVYPWRTASCIYSGGIAGRGDYRRHPGCSSSKSGPGVLYRFANWGFSGQGIVFCPGYPANSHRNPAHNGSRISDAMREPAGKGLLLPMLDARRMEVYSAVFNYSGEQIRETRAEVIDENSFSEYRKQGTLHLIGNGAAKLTEVLPDPPFAFHPNLQSSARFMGVLAHEAFTAGDFQDTAYFEPNYLKDFIPGGK